MGLKGSKFDSEAFCVRAIRYPNLLRSFPGSLFIFFFLESYPWELIVFVNFTGVLIWPLSLLFSVSEGSIGLFVWLRIVFVRSRSNYVTFGICSTIIVLF